MVMEQEISGGLVITPTIPALADIVTVTKSTAQTDGTWYVILDIANTFPIPLAPEGMGQGQFAFMAKPPIHL